MSEKRACYIYKKLNHRVCVTLKKKADCELCMDKLVDDEKWNKRENRKFNRT
jgi:hypothetical protein